MNELTEREREILHLVADGLTQKAIAGILYISQRSVEKALERARDRCGADSTTHLVAKYAESRI